MTERFASYLKNSSVAAIAAASLVLGVPAVAQQGGGSASGQVRSPQGGGQQNQGAGARQGGGARGGETGQGAPAQSGQGGAGSAGEGASSQGGSGSAGANARVGGQGGTSLDDIMRDAGSDEADSDSDRPAWAGEGGGPNDRGEPPSASGSKKGDLFGDLYVILRDDNGVPILTEPDEDGNQYVQPIDADGNPIALNEDGTPVDPSEATAVELGRLNAGRSPEVIDQREAEVVSLLSTALNVSLDVAGRLVVTTEFEILRDEDGNPILTAPDDDGNQYVQPIDADGNPVPLDADGNPIDPSLPVPAVQKTIDSPLENLALYVTLLETGTIAGLTDLPGDEFDNLVDGTFTAADLVSAASFLAAASDKDDDLTPDEVAYLDAFLGINTTSTDDGSVTWSVIDYSNFEYDRTETYDVWVDLLVQQPDGSWETEPVNIMDAVFNKEPYNEGGTLTAFAQAAEDALAVITYIHEYEVPESLPLPEEPPLPEPPAEETL